LWQRMSDRLAPTERHAFLHQGRTIYEWDQTLSEVNIYVQLPPGARAKQLYVDITSARLRIGITPGQPYLDVRGPACSAAHCCPPPALAWAARGLFMPPPGRT